MIDVDLRSPVPPYDQIRAQLTAQITSGELPEGTRLPSIRQLAGDLGLAPGTVARAYRELESAGLVAGRGRQGTRVAAPPATPAIPPHPALLDEAAARYAAAAVRSGSSLDQAVDALRRAFARGRTPGTDTGGGAGDGHGPEATAS